MKIFIIATLLVGSVFGADSVLLKVQKYGKYFSHSIRFDVNKDLGRAWIVLYTDTSPSDPEFEPDEERIKIEGLSYKDGEIVFEKDGLEVVCASEVTSGLWIFKGTRMKETGLCFLEKEDKIVLVDDGFNIQEVEKSYLYLTIQ